MTSTNCPGPGLPCLVSRHPGVPWARVPDQSVVGRSSVGSRVSGRDVLDSEDAAGRIVSGQKARSSHACGITMHYSTPGLIRRTGRRVGVWVWCGFGGQLSCRFQGSAWPGTLGCKRSLPLALAGKAWALGHLGRGAVTVCVYGAQERDKRRNGRGRTEGREVRLLCFNTLAGQDRGC